ncbi:MAG: acyl--CoA ligase, partial [Hyphomicrobiales bacterium]|nr:acyl--CoA ligase [Hyphomicrobiales bacterium]
MPLDAAQKELEVRRSLIEDLAERSENLVYSRACDLNAEQFPDHPALIDRNNRLNWSDVKSISDRLAMALLESNVMRPDIALIHLSNSAEQFLIRLACEKAGVRVLLTNSAFRETELASLIERTRPAVAFVSAEKAGRGDYDRLLEMLGAAGTKLQLILVGGGTQTEWARSYEALLAEAPQVYARILDRTRFDWDERFYLTTTSGSTSAPKIA